MNARREDEIRRAVELMLGPEGDEVSCEECFARIDEYVELELGDADADARIPGFRNHLVGCPACREEYESLRALVSSGGRS